MSGLFVLSPQDCCRCASCRTAGCQKRYRDVKCSWTRVSRKRIIPRTQNLTKTNIARQGLSFASNIFLVVHVTRFFQRLAREGSAVLGVVIVLIATTRIHRRFGTGIVHQGKYIDGKQASRDVFPWDVATTGFPEIFVGVYDDKSRGVNHPGRYTLFMKLKGNYHMEYIPLHCLTVWGYTQIAPAKAFPHPPTDPNSVMTLWQGACSPCWIHCLFCGGARCLGLTALPRRRCLSNSAFRPRVFPRNSTKCM